MAAQLTTEQELAAEKFLEIVNARCRWKQQGPIKWSTAVRFLFARKFDVDRAVALFQQHELTRHREGLANFDPNTEPLFSELKTGKFTVLPKRDGSEAAIVVFTAHKHIPSISTHQTTLQGVVYQLDVALKNPTTQRNGIVFIYDMSNSKYSNFDYDLSQKILTLLKGGYPAKLKKVLIVTAPLWFKAPFKILRLFVREKLRERVYTVSVAQLLSHIPRESLPTQLGGNLPLDHDGWLEDCLQMTTRPDSPPNSTHDGKSPSSPQKLISSSNNTNNTTTTNNELEISASPNNINNINNMESSWAEEGSLNPPSSASSGFSDDDSLHGDGAAMTIAQLVEHVRDRGREGLTQDYMEIRTRPPDGTFTVAKLKNNLPKNRYTDVLCYDHSRVILSELDGESDTDYIHANFVDGYKQKNAFINTQGPLPKTAAEFWRMIWEQQTLVIVMTTRAMERSRPKCHQYWEADLNGKVVYGDFTISTLAKEANADYTVSTLQLSNSKTDEVRNVSHWQFTSWPDYGVPQSAKAMLEFLERVRRQQAAMVLAMGDTWAGHPRGPPIVVHCSAGIGRTGTFCTLDICISRLEDVGSADIRGTVEKIRSQRAYSIQMPDQYVFCHIALIEYALVKGHLQSADLPEFGTDDDSD
ncbi:PREDICTED: tyrosine-protein phosphatase non-receptor type 9 [Nicrophorus vespilloides]|uniref:Tyrosine-protein phosphatase non-receptor type 9 n=1 Tax=Nicrophorus vespilloides TaxID=110193 RepID=A0ABM1MTR0_NICVS|nr:PREDICTED: tyrosine-protein phosphatase non-receptor type 9 [Nicrophorus vespilloides]